MGHVFHALTRCVAVFFGYMLVEGFHYTRNQKSLYLSALWLGTSDVHRKHPDQLCFKKHLSSSQQYFSNIAVGASLLYLITQIQAALSVKKKLLLSILFVVLLLPGLFTEGGMVVLPSFSLLTLLRGVGLNEISYTWFLRWYYCCCFDLPPILQSQTPREFWLNFGFNSSWLFVTVIPLLHLYNEEKGSGSSWAKYLFYIYYPLHLWLIALLVQLAGNSLDHNSRE